MQPPQPVPKVQPVTRPFGVTIVVILIWIGAIAYIILGMLFLFTGTDAESQGEVGNVTNGTLRGIGIGLIVLGILEALIAMGLSRGSNLLRIQVSLIVVLGIIGNVVALSENKGNYLLYTVISILISIFILGLLWTSNSSGFFKQPKQAKRELKTRH